MLRREHVRDSGSDFARVVPDVARRDDEDDVLGDVGGVVADAFEMAGDQDQVERRLDGAAGPAACR